MKCNQYLLGDVCNFIDYRGKTPPKQNFGIPLITAKIVKNGTILPPTEFISEEYYDEWMRRGIPKKGAVIFTTEAPLGEVAQINTSEKLAFAQRVIILDPKEEILSPDYLLFALQEGLLKSRIQSRASGTTVVGIKSSELKKVVIDLPDLSTQRRIAAILSSLDDKIELNNKINANLKEQAQALFKSWFVDFEPWGGVMPEGWREGTLAELCFYSKEKISISKIDLTSYYSTENMLPEKLGATVASGLPSVEFVTSCKPGDTLISNIRPYFKKILYCDRISGCSNDVLCLRPIDKKYSHYVYALAYGDEFFDYMMSGAKGTKMPRGDKQLIMRYPVFLPSEQHLIEFNKLLSHFYSMIRINMNENLRLAELRDTLLPMLMSGELDVSDIELSEVSDA